MPALHRPAFVSHIDDLLAYTVQISVDPLSTFPMMWFVGTTVSHRKDITPASND